MAQPTAQFTDSELAGAASKQYMVGTGALDRVSLGIALLFAIKEVLAMLSWSIYSLFLFERTSIQPYNVTQKW